MIVELFGPPAVGKTRFAQELVVLAPSSGIALTVLASDRPAEHAMTTRFPAVLTRLGRHGASVLARRPAVGVAAPHATLLRLFPPRSPMWTFRLRNYLRRLDAAMHARATGGGVVVIDQGFVQAFGSLLVLARRRDAEGLEAALAEMPRADLLVRLDAPQGLLRRRHAERLGRMSWTERWLELGLDDTLAFAPYLDLIQALLEAHGARVITVDSSTPESTRTGALRVLAAIAERHSAASECAQDCAAA